MFRSIIVDHLETLFGNDRDVVTVCIYCNYKDQTNQTTYNLIGSLLRQLVEDDSVAYNNVKPLYEPHRANKTRPTFNEIRKTLQSEAQRYSKVFVVVDALDESSEVDGTRANLLNTLRSLGVSLLVTSRDLDSITRDFHGTKRLDIKASEQDLRTYIESQIALKPRLATHVKNDPTLREKIGTKIIEKVEGM